jgi:hypothetical protein
MEWGHEEATQEFSRRGPRQVRRLSPERGQKTGQPRKWPQGRPGQEPQEENCCPAKRARPAAGKAPEEGVNAANRLDSCPFRPSRDRPELWRNPLFGERTPLHPSVGWTQSSGEGSLFNCPFCVRMASESR